MVDARDDSCGHQRAQEVSRRARIGLLFDGKECVLDEYDLLEVANILKTVFEVPLI